MVNNEKHNNQVSEQTYNKSSKRSWTVTILAFLLTIQGLGMLALASYHLTLVNLSLVITPGELLTEFPVAMTGLAFYGLGLLGLLASLGFFRLWPFAWVLAITQQGLNLTVAISLYFQNKPFYIFPMMLYSILMVIYLHYSDIIATFRTRPVTEEWGGIDEE